MGHTFNGITVKQSHVTYAFTRKCEDGIERHLSGGGLTVNASNDYAKLDAMCSPHLSDNDRMSTLNRTWSGENAYAMAIEWMAKCQFGYRGKDTGDLSATCWITSAPSE